MTPICGPDSSLSTRLGEELAVWVRLREDTVSRVTEDTVRDYCRGRLAHFKIPRSGKLDSGSWSW